MAQERPGIMVYFDDILPSLQCLSLEDAGRLFIAMLQYGRDRTEPDFKNSAGLAIAWSFIKVKIDRDSDNYDRSVLKSRYGVYKRECGRRKDTPLGFDEWCMLVDHPSSPMMSPSYPIMEAYPTATATSNSNQQPQQELEPQLNGEDTDVSSCVEPETGSTPPIIGLPLNDGTEYGVTEEQCKEWAELYPAVDVPQQLRNMRGWLLANKDRRKTKLGVGRFITAWLSREQDRGRGGGGAHGAVPSAGTNQNHTGKKWGVSVVEL